jgi:hypothetical protein
MKMLRLKNLLKKLTDSIQHPAPNNYVSLILKEKIRVKRVSKNNIDELKILGGYIESISGDICWIIPASGKTELGKLLARLRDLGFLFADEPGGWPPAAIFRDLRGRGYVDGDFQAVTWHGPGKWRIYKS